jgi:2-polyprenyl-6-methoxyphenol hydroxylase-like FAD-dependent oxidoreductase
VTRSGRSHPDVAIVGAGIGGLTFALQLHRLGIPCRIYEAAATIEPVGVGINILPHATHVLGELDVTEGLAARAVETRESAFFNRFGQLIYREPAGVAAGYRWPQFSAHRADIYGVLLDAALERLGPDSIFFGWRCTGVAQDDNGITAQFRSADGDAALPDQHASVLVGCDGIHSVVRHQHYPKESEPRYSGVNMWRGVTVWEPFLTSATMVRAGWLTTGKMVIYPIRDNIDGHGRQLVNWVAEVETPNHERRDWNRRGLLEDFLPRFADWHFDWLDVPALIQSSETVLEFPMVDQDPLPAWTFGRITLLGDAAHPMVPRGSNGAGQAIIDAQVLAGLFAEVDPETALRAYEDRRLPATAGVVQANRTNPPDAILREVYLRTGDQPFGDISDVITTSELVAITDEYRVISGAATPPSE